MEYSMVMRASPILAEIAYAAINDVFRSYRLAFRESRVAGLENSRACAASFRGPNASGQIQFAIEESVLDATSVPREKRQDLVNELTNMAVGCIESELLRRGLAIRYSPPRTIAATNLEFFKRGSDGVVCFLEETAGRVAVGIEMNLAPGAVLEASPTRRLPDRGPAGLNLPHGKANPGRVLIVDDSANAREGVATALAGAGFDVVQADSGVAALRVLRERTDIRLMFTDLHMAGIPGADLIRKIKDELKFVRLPIVVLTASPAAVAEIDPAHIVTCLLKPISPAAVISLAHRVLAAC